MWVEVGWERVSVWVSGQGAWMLKAPCTGSLRPHTVVALTGEGVVVGVGAGDMDVLIAQGLIQ